MEPAPQPDNVREVVPFLSVPDIERSVRFYVEGLGFEMTHHWKPEGRLRWCRLQLGGAGLMLQEHLHDGDRAWKPDGKLGEGVTLCFMCGDALAIYHAALAQGLEASRPFVGNGLWVTTLHDPDGFRIDFESPTDAPEESVYSEPE
jgi:lactoylglutathione lyase